MTGAGWLGEFAILLIELLALLFAVSAGLALAVRRIGLQRLQRGLGGRRLAATLKGAALGFVVPFCSYSAIPTVVAMVDAKVRTATLAGFLLAAPLLDPVVLMVLWLLFGWQATAAYAAVTAATVITLALVADRFGADRLLLATRHPIRTSVRRRSRIATVENCGTPDPFNDEQPWTGPRNEVAGATRYAAGLVRQLALPMVVAVALAAAIIGFVPQELLARLAGPDNPLAVPVAAALGVPFYVSTEAFLPIASALHRNGMGLGATFALVIAAAGINAPELILLSRLMKLRLLFGYVGAVVATALAAGYLVPALI